MSNPKYKVVQLRMSLAELERIKSIAKQAKVTPSQAVNVMLAAYMFDQKAQTMSIEPTCRETARLRADARFREETTSTCWCEKCRPITMYDMRMVLCPECGNKRCPHATDHNNECTARKDAK